MIIRKIWRELDIFREKNGSEALLLDGARQVGKTYIVRKYAEANYKSFIEINFIKNPTAKSLFDGLWDENDFFVKLSALTTVSLIPHDTLIFFDEVQACPEVVTYIKFLVDDGRFHYILSGSLLGIELKDVRSAPVGYMREVRMFPLDLQEFACAVGVQDSVLSYVKDRLEHGQSIDKLVHAKLMKVFRLYLVVGGMPAVVAAYLKNQNIQDVIREQTAILTEYRRDASKYDKKDKLHIIRVLELLPSELNRENKRFYVTDIKEHEKYSRVSDDFIWLTNAGIAIPVHNVDSPRLPLELAKKANLFKLFLNDVGLLSSMYMDGLQLKILNGQIDVNFGAVYENFAAQELTAHGHVDLYYFNSKKHGEIDFLLERDGEALPIEIKSGADYKLHRALDNMMGVADYHLQRAMVYNTSETVERGRITYLPIYALMYLERNRMTRETIFRIDI